MRRITNDNDKYIDAFNKGHAHGIFSVFVTLCACCSIAIAGKLLIDKRQREDHAAVLAAATYVVAAAVCAQLVKLESLQFARCCHFTVGIVLLSCRHTPCTVLLACVAALIQAATASDTVLLLSTRSAAQRT
jgi:hypothetical protein